MNNTDKYNKFKLVHEMLETPGIIKNFKLNDTDELIHRLHQKGKLFLTGEGSSRLFPAKNAIMQALRSGTELTIYTEGGYQASEYGLKDFVVFGASNSGRTKEVVRLFNRLLEKGHQDRFGLTANTGTELESLSEQAFILACGKEEAVAATKSVAEQALFLQSLLALAEGKSIAEDLVPLADAVQEALIMDIPRDIARAIADAGTIFFAGRNDGVAEELTLKTNEITRKKSDFFEGTYLVHGVEEVMRADDVVILIDPFEEELDQINRLIARGVGCNVIAISTKNTCFPTIKVKDVGELTNYVYLAAGWNLLVETGITLGVDLDKPVRARKVGNLHGAS
jgi:glucosamine--fructose-6-phosphate aminotransferase (isomerizing)